MAVRTEQSHRLLLKQSKRPIQRKKIISEQAKTEEFGATVRANGSAMVLQQVQMMETFTTKELGAMLGIGERASQKRIRVLLDAGKVVKIREGKKVFYRRI